MFFKEIYQLKSSEKSSEMTSVTFYGGIGTIGGNVIVVESEGSTILLDFGKDFTAENEFFSEYLRPRKAHGIGDFLELGFLPPLEGVYRRDYLRHLGGDPAENPEIDAVFLTHGHVDHIGYVHFLRSDIPVYCTPTTRAIMKVRQETGSMTFNEYCEKKKSFYLRKKSRSDELTRLTKRDGKYESVDINPVEERKIYTVEDGESVDIGDLTVSCHGVNHSLPGACGYHVKTPDARIVYTGDLRLHGYRSENTENFIHESKDFDPDVLICEGTNVGEKEVTSERDVEEKLSSYLGGEEDSAFINFPNFDLERMVSVVEAAEENGRDFILRCKQAAFLRALEEEDLLPFEKLSPNKDSIKVMIPKKGWGSIIHRFRSPRGEWKKLDEMDISPDNKDKLVARDYGKWEREFVFEDGNVTVYDLKERLDEVLIYMDYYKLNDLIDLSTSGGSFFWSKTEPFTPDMRIDQRRVHNWLNHFNLGLVKAHASGHLSEWELEDMVKMVDPEVVLPVHTEEPQWFKSFEVDLPSIRYGKKIKIS